MTEFVFFNEEKNRLISLEAKKSAPNPNSEKMEHPREKFQEYIQGICKKFENSIDLYSSMALKKELPEGFYKIDYKNLQVILMLVIKNHEKGWLKDVKDDLELSVRQVLRLDKIWKCRVLVLNEEQAWKRGLVQGNVKK